MSSPKRIHSVSLTLVSAALVWLSGMSSVAVADPVDLSQVPVVNNTSVAPNVLLTFDDSGSMAATSLPAGLYAQRAKKFYYSITTNKVYFDPLKDYPAPPKPDGTFFPDSTYTSAWGDGFCANWPSSASPGCTPRTVNLSKAFCTKFVVDDNSGSPPNANQAGNADASNCPSTKEGFWYDCPTANSETLCVQKTVGADAALRKKFANWYSYYRTRNLMARTSVATAFVQVDDKIRMAWQNFNANQLSATTTIATFGGTQRTNFFDWLYKLPTGNSTPTIESVQRAGKFFSSGYTNGKGTGANGKFNPYWEPIANMTGGGMELACRQNYSMVVTDGYFTNSVAAPSAATVNTEATLVLPQNDSVTPAVATKTYDPSKSYATVFKPKLDNTLAATSFYYWATDLRPDLKNRVPPFLGSSSIGITDASVRPIPLNPFDDDEIYFNPANDPAIWQHVVQYMVGLGVSGTLPLGDATLLELRKGTKSWPAIGSEATKSDDSWHAAVNSRGDYFSAKDTGELVTAMLNILTSISLRRSSASALSVSSSVISAGSLSYGTGYDSASWSGSVVARNLRDDGTLGPVLWDAACVLTGGACATTGINAGAGIDPDTREILTASSPSGAGVPFKWSSLSSQQQTWLNQNPATGTVCTSPTGSTGGCDGFGSDRLSYLRGDRTQEAGGAVPPFRTRATLLGAVINSSAVYHSLPSSGYRDIFPDTSLEAAAALAGDTYEKFVHDHKDNRGVIYVGANDGMLHAFDSADGSELWAYVPYAVSKNLNKLTTPAFKYQAFVDNSPEIMDVFTNSEWRTLLVGTLRMGGRGVYALDVTDPDAVTEGNAADVVKWEFSGDSTGAENLGYTFGQPNIVRLSNGKWAVLVPAGYFQDPATDGNDPTSSLPAASLKVSSLFVLDAEDGSIIAELKTPSAITSYGLSTAAVGSYGRSQIADFAVAGDLVGNLWRFDLTDLSTVDRIFAPAVNGAQPITVMPQLFPDTKTQGVIAVFGTGKYLGLKDRETKTMPVQAYYGIREYGAGSAKYPVKVADLVKQTLTIDSATTYRTLTDNDVPVSKKGWYFDLDKVEGERNVLRAGRLINSNRAVLLSLIPAGDDPCDPSIKGGLMIVDAANGGPPAGPPPVGGGAALPEGTAQVVGRQIADPPQSGSPPLVTPPGGGAVIIPGTDAPGIPPITVSDSYWRRRAWRTMSDGL